MTQCSVCGSDFTVESNVISRHSVPGTRFPCPKSSNPLDARAAIIDAAQRLDTK